MTINSTGERHTPKKWSILALTIWGIAVIAIGYFGLFAKIGTFWIAPTIAAGIVIPVLVYYVNYLH
jgi:hypothetical protein